MMVWPADTNIEREDDDEDNDVDDDITYVHLMLTEPASYLYPLNERTEWREPKKEKKKKTRALFDLD